MKILFITSTRLGDAVLSTGLLEHLRAQYPEARVTVACGRLPESIFGGFPNVERILPMRKARYNAHWLKLWRNVAGTRWDMVVDLRNSAVSRLIRARQRFIFGPHIDRGRHKAEQAADVMELDYVPAPTLYFTKTQQNFASVLMENPPLPNPPPTCGGREEGASASEDGGTISSAVPILAVGPSANWIGKTWPGERFIEVIRWITAAEGPLPGARVAVFAAPGEEDQARPVLDSVPQDRQIDGIAKGSPGDIAAALSRCALYIGNDSGLMHCAAAAAVPTFGLFGPSWPHLYRPWGEHAAYAATPENFGELTGFDGYDPKTLDHTLMESLRVESVLDELQKFWEQEKAA